jgi:DNA-binding NtrC family response regulator
MSWVDEPSGDSGTQVALRQSRPALARHCQTFTWLRGDLRGQQQSTEGPRVILGSGDACDIVLRDDTVSSRHCEVRIRGGRYVVEDLGSTNGTFVEGVEIGLAYLEFGAKLALGETELRFEPELEWRPVPATEATRFGEMVGQSPAMRPVFALLERVAPTALTCLVVGPTGTGKEACARAIHDASARHRAPFVVIDCGAVSPTLVEAELFGHARGAFTGADRAREGSFRAAHGGTVLLDEVGDLPLELQAKLLRVLERREVKALGEEVAVDVDIRVVAATHRDLPAMVEAGTFREDLYYRLAEVVIRLPPLSGRSEDFPMLIQSIVDAEAARGGGPRMVTPEAFEYLARRDYPGNVRELRSVLRRAMAFARTASITCEDVEGSAALGPARFALEAPAPAHLELPIGDGGAIREAREGWITTLEPVYCERLLQRFGSDLDAAASHAGLHRKTLLRLLKAYGMSPVALED